MRYRWPKPNSSPPYYSAAFLADFMRQRIHQVEETGCWEWSGTRHACGYGVVKGGGHGQKTLLAHRVSVWLRLGAWPQTEQHVCHKCDNPPCCNPDHLYVGTPRSNFEDTRRNYLAGKGNIFYANWHLSRALTDKQVMRCRNQFYGPRGTWRGDRQKHFKLTIRSIGVKHGIPFQSLRRVLAGEQHPDGKYANILQQNKKLAADVVRYREEMSGIRNTKQAYSIEFLARRHNVSVTCMHNAVTGRHYAHLPMPENAIVYHCRLNHLHEVGICNLREQDNHAAGRGSPQKAR